MAKQTKKALGLAGSAKRSSMHTVHAGTGGVDVGSKFRCVAVPRELSDDRLARFAASRVICTGLPTGGGGDPDGRYGINGHQLDPLVRNP
jgi:hypothetical protein